MSKQLEGILGRATRATPAEVAKPNVVPPQAPQEVEALLQARIPAGVKTQVLKRALEEGVTVRTFLLRALKTAGIDVAGDQLKDRRGKGQQ
ncbi:hypothetical protein [uncultured Hyphomicrobium sp.]|jgi:hypothetical protein|uniref:hypothetical protein n=1 Tax=uncultured Hyphomicrobium sp. TaxID=194373 RepID=UPI0025F09BB4|nr:hypothetical protein [uncultured Hyphomicrobium sp.]